MTLTRDSLQVKLDGLQQQRTQLHDTLCAVDGAILLCQDLIKEADAPPPPEPEPPSGNHP